MVRITIRDTGGAAFGETDDELRWEVVRILRKIVSQMENGASEGPCMDVCGNKVGDWRMRR